MSSPAREHLLLSAATPWSFPDVRLWWYSAGVKKTAALTLPVRSGKQHLSYQAKRDILALHAAGLSQRVIAKRVGCNPKTAAAVVKKATPLMKAGAGDRAADLMGVPREELRAQQKQVLMARLGDLTEEACAMLLGKIHERDAQGFRDTATALEKVDKISGNTVGEAQGTTVVAPVVHIDLRGLIDRVLERATMEQTGATSNMAGLTGRPRAGSTLTAPSLERVELERGPAA